MKYSLPIAVMLGCLASPALAIGLGDLAKVVLNNGSVLKTAEQKCGTQARLTRSDLLSLTMAQAAAERALPISQFTALSTDAEQQATTAAQAPDFCTETKKKKSGLMTKIKKAGKAILQAKMLGI